MNDPIDVRIVELNTKKEYQRLIDGDQQSFGIKAGRVYLESGQECGEHSTKDREEILIFLSGQGILIAGNKKEYPVGCGKISYIPPETLHNIKNIYQEPLIYIFCVAPILKK